MSDAHVIPESTSDQASISNSKSATTSGSTKLTGVALWTAIAAVAVWIGFSIFLITRAGTNETEWARIAWVFGSIQAIAFAAAGALFGTSVQQQNVNNAQQAAASAKKDADQQRQDAIKGRALATAIQAEAGVPPNDGAGAPQRMAISGATGAESPDQVRQRHAQLSRAMFGDLI